MRRLGLFLSVLDRKLVRELWQIKSQALAIAGVIAAGVALFVLMLSTQHSLELTRERYYQQNQFPDIFASLIRAPLQLETHMNAIEGVAFSRTRVVTNVALDIEGLTEPASGRLVSLPEEAPRLCGIELIEGRYLDANRENEVLVNTRFAHANGFKPGSSVTAVINGRKRKLEIVGIASSPEFVYHMRPGELLPDDKRSGVIWMGRRSLAASLDMEGGFNDVLIKLQPQANRALVIEELDRLLAPYGALGAIPRAQQTSHWFLENELTQLKTMATAIPMIFLAVAAFLLNVVLSRIVAVQREEIAAIKAVGYANSAIAFHFVKWSLAISLLGGGIGVLCGALLGRGMTAMYTTFFDFPYLVFELPGDVVAKALLVAIVAALFGALSSVRKAVTLPPAEAMRPEPPARYTKSLIEQLGMQRFFSQPTRIIFRNLQRNLGRSLISLFGIAAGGALLIVGSFSLDSVDLMTKLQFEVAQRFDVMVTLNQAASQSARQDFASMPGVQQVEAFRVVPVEIKHKHMSRQLGITSLMFDAQLNRLVDAQGRIIQPRNSGLILSATLADLLDIDVGDEIELQVLEGRRRHHQVRVTQIIDDLMGTNAYMESQTLHLLMEESASVSGAYLSVNPLKTDELYSQLKKTPRVAGVMRKGAARESLQKTMDESVGTVRTFNVMFALIIAFGVVYNGARITLAERSRELATLRVIGFRRTEISYILLGEIAILTLVAIPLSMFMGYVLASATVSAMNTEVFRIPLVVSPRTYAFGAVTIMIATTISGLIVRRRLDHLDLIAVLKTRE